MNFDRIARPYRWLEYATLGRILERTRAHFLSQLKERRRALVFGDGDGRFLAALLKQNPETTAEALDISGTMLQLLRQRCAFAVNRLVTQQADARSFHPQQEVDLVTTHFFLDCLTQSELETFVGNVAPSLRPGGLWLVSDFQIASGSLRLPAELLVRSLYLAFRVITGLKTDRLPDHEGPFQKAGLTLIQKHCYLGGILFTELWQSPEPTDL